MPDNDERVSVKVVQGPDEVDDEDIGDEVVLICIGADDPTPFTDNVKTTCSTCGTPVQHRPHVPKKSVPYCQECALARARVDMESGEDVKVFITRKSAEEIKTFIDNRNARRKH